MFVYIKNEKCAVLQNITELSVILAIVMCKKAKISKRKKTAILKRKVSRKKIKEERNMYFILLNCYLEGRVEIVHTEGQAEDSSGVF